jgi:hypothetical protein
MASDGTYYAVYTEYDAVSHEDVFLVHFLLDGTVDWTASVALAMDTQQYPTIAIDSLDYAHIAYCDESPVTDSTIYRRYDILNAIWDAPITLTTTTSDDGPSIAIDSSNQVHVVYDYVDGADHCIGYSFSGDGGVSFFPTERVSPAFVPFFAFDYYPSIAIGTDDTVNVAWQGYGRGSNHDHYQIQFRQRDPGTATWVNYYEVTENANGNMFQPSIACDLNSNVHIAWTDATGAYSTNGAAYRMRSIMGIWGSFIDPATTASGEEVVGGITLTTSGGVYILTSDALDATIDCLVKPNGTGAWGLTDNVTGVTGSDDDIHPWSSWSMYPIVNDLRSNYPTNGYVFTYSRDTTIAQPNSGAGELRFCAVSYGFGTAIPENIDGFTAYPNGCGRIDLSWDDPNDAHFFPNTYVVVRGSIYGYPDNPPTDPSADYSRLIYDQQVSLGAGAVSDSGLISGRTYYYRIWLYDEDTDTYTLCGQDMATANACTDYAPSDAPPGWYQEPTCDLYYETILWPAMNYAIGQYQMPDKYFCMLTTFFMISVCCIASFPLAVVGSSVSPKSMVTPFAIGCALIIATASAGAIPLGISIVGFVCLGGIAVFIWTRV